VLSEAKRVKANLPVSARNWSAKLDTLVPSMEGEGLCAGDGVQIYPGGDRK